LRPIVAADGQQPEPSSRERASASASSTKRSLAEVGELAHTPVHRYDAHRAHPARRRAPSSCPILALPVALCDTDPRGRLGVRFRSRRGAASSRQTRLGAVASAERTLLTCAITPKQAPRTPACPARDSSPSRSPRRARRVAPPACRPVEGRPTSCLSFCLIHPRPAPFTDVHPDRVYAVRGRWRTAANIVGKRVGGNPSRVRISHPPPR
jgi:hypothetical protein